MEVDSELPILFAAINADGAAASGFSREKAELAPTQGFKQISNTLGFFSGIKNELANFTQLLPNSRAQSPDSFLEQFIGAGHQATLNSGK